MYHLDSPPYYTYKFGGVLKFFLVFNSVVKLIDSLWKNNLSIIGTFLENDEVSYGPKGIMRSQSTCQSPIHKH